MATIVFQADKRIGVTYAYESTAFWDKEKKQSRAKRTYMLHSVKCGQARLANVLIQNPARSDAAGRIPPRPERPGLMS